MLTFEKVFSVFSPFLIENEIYEIVSTSHGHTVLEWDSRAQEWISVKLCDTPEKLAETLLDDLTGYLEYKATLGRRDLTYDDMAQVNGDRRKFCVIDTARRYEKVRRGQEWKKTF